MLRVSVCQEFRWAMLLLHSVESSWEDANAGGDMNGRELESSGVVLSLNVFGPWAVMTWKLDSAGGADQTTYIQPQWLDLLLRPSRVPWVGVWRPSIPELVRSCLAFLTWILVVVPVTSTVCCWLWMNFWGQPYARRMKLGLPSLGEVCKAALQKGMWGWKIKIVTHFWEYSLSHYLCSSNSYTLSACWMLPREHPHCLEIR